MPNNFKRGIDRMMWVPTIPAPITHQAGMGFCSDLRSDVSRNPYVYYLTSTANLHRYNIVTKGWDRAQNTLGLGGTIGAGSACVFAPSQSVVGVLAAGSTTNKVVLSSLSTTVYANTMANRGGSGEYGYKIRIASISAGKTEERFIVGNSSGSTNVSVQVNQPFTFTPASGDIFEILAGSVYVLSAGSSSFRRMNLALMSTMTALNSPGTTGAETGLIALDEQYTPYDCHPGEGMIKGGYLYDSGLVDRYALVATGTTSTSLDAQLVGGDADCVTNEYKNFQIRIVEDTVTPAAVGQRRIIQSHNGGPGGRYFLGVGWTTTPSANAKYVIELPNLLIMQTNLSTAVAAYNYGTQTYQNGIGSPLGAGTWGSFITASTVLNPGGFWAPSWGIRPDAERVARQSYFYRFRGGSSSALDLFDFAGATWSTNIIYDGNMDVNTSGSCAAYDPIANEGRMNYIQQYATGTVNTVKRFDVKNLTMAPFTSPDLTESGSAVVGNRLAVVATDGGADAYTNLLMLRMGSTVTNELLVLA